MIKQELSPSPLLDFQSAPLRQLIASRGWADLPERQRIKEIYDFVRLELPFGYNISDRLSASQVLRDGYGQCNTKSTLFMALLRGVGVPCRLHGWTIDKRLQKGAIPRLLYWLAPSELLHSWVEVLHEGRWLRLEGYILDHAYLTSVQRAFPDHCGEFCGYAVATDRFEAPPVEWLGGDTFIQNRGLRRDLGVFATPDEFYARFGRNLRGLKALFFGYVARHYMNWNVARIRAGKLPRTQPRAER